MHCSVRIIKPYNYPKMSFLFVKVGVTGNGECFANVNNDIPGRTVSCRRIQFENTNVQTRMLIGKNNYFLDTQVILFYGYWQYCLLFFYVARNFISALWNSGCPRVSTLLCFKGWAWDGRRESFIINYHVILIIFSCYEVDAYCTIVVT